MFSAFYAVVRTRQDGVEGERVIDGEKKLQKFEKRFDFEHPYLQSSGFFLISSQNQARARVRGFSSELYVPNGCTGPTIFCVFFSTLVVDFLLFFLSLVLLNRIGGVLFCIMGITNYERRGLGTPSCCFVF